MTTKTAKPAAGEAVPARPSQTEMLDALKQLEWEIYSLMHVSDIAAEAFGDLVDQLHRVENRPGIGGQYYHFSDHEVDQFSYLVNDMASRCSTLRDRYLAAFRGEALK